jgi:threonine aldolase
MLQRPCRPAPVGYILAGEKGFIDRARKRRKLMGGGLKTG